MVWQVNFAAYTDTFWEKILIIPQLYWLLTNVLHQSFLFARNSSLKDGTEEITFQGDFVKELVQETDYGYDLDVDDIFHSWKADKYKDIMSYRDQSFASKFTGTQSPIHHSTFMNALDDSLECFMGEKK